MASIKGRCEPAYNIVSHMGGVKSTAKLLKINPSTVSRWLTTPDNGGTGGNIPQKHWPSILRHAKRFGINLDVYDLSGLKRG